ncbi:MAG: 50S ribosomal protein L18 [Armatimonadetes bacterium]|nr:50S ribosomal protein L18 [Armatimonadota bacterium]
MSSKVTRYRGRERRALRVRKKISGSPARPRLTVYRSLRHIYAQVVDDGAGRTLAAASSLDPELRESAKGRCCETARQVGLLLARRAKEAGIESVVFDRNGYLYHGCVKAVAEGAREGELRL